MTVSLQTFYRSKTDAEQHEFKAKIRFRWLRFLPSFGFNIGQARPFIGYNTSDLVGAINSKQTKKALLESIARKNEVLFNQDRVEVKYLIENLRHKVSVYEAKLAVYKLEKELFDLLQLEYEKGEIPPTQYLQKKISFENLRVGLVELKYSLVELKNSILIKSKKADAISLF